jgi:hypothetical protein
VGVGETFQLVVTVTEQKKIKDLPWPQVKGNLDAFTIAKNSGTSSGTQTTIVNGRITKQVNYVTNFTFSLTANKQGTFVIGPIIYSYGKFSKNFGSTRITVVKTEPGVKLETTVSRRTAYLGQQVTYNLRIIFKNTVQNIQHPNPQIQNHVGKSFWIKSHTNEIKAKTITMNGVPTRVVDTRFSIFPLIAGKVTLSGFPIDYEEVVARRRRSRSIFDMFDSDFFGGTRIKKKAQTGAVTLNVLPLPKDAPKDFSGAVGTYQLKASVDKTELPTGDALTFTIEISGNGQPKAITRPVLPELDRFEIFDPEIKSSTKVSQGRLLSFKSFKYILIPTKKGEYTINPVAFHYFDPASKSYKTASSESFTITVSKGKHVETTKARFLTQKDIEEIGSDIRHIKKTAGTALVADRFMYRSIWFWGLFTLSPVLYGVLLMYRNRTRRLDEDVSLRRKVHAKGVARKRLADARRALGGTNPKVYYHALMQAVERFVSDKLNMEFRGMTIDNALETLKEREIPEDNRNAYKALMEKCDMGQFALLEKNEQEWNTAYRETETLINRLNKVL